MSQPGTELDGASFNPLNAQRERQLICAFLVLGLLARCVRYFLCFPLWDDECFLCFNLIDRNYTELLQPLQFHQVAPWLFLWIEATFVKIFGFTELSLRLFPFLCSVASLFIFRGLASRLMRGLPLVLAIGIFSVAYPCIRYSAEAKQYGTDLFASLVLLTLTVRWWQHQEKTKILWTLVALMPVMISLSYPAVLTAGGVSLTVGHQLWRTGQRQGRGAWALLNVGILASLGLIYILCARHQSGAELAWMQHYWQRSFPPLREAGKMPFWLLTTHVGGMFAYPLGSENGGSSVTFLCCVVAVVTLIRRRDTKLLILFLTPLLLHFIAACLKRYPYGQHPKFGQYLAPILCLLMGLGGAVMINWWSARPRIAHRAVAGWLIALALIGTGCIVRDIAHPYKTEADMRLRAFSRWFWVNMPFEAEVACLRRDLGQTFSPESYEDLTYTAMYQCNREIYSPRHRRGEPIRLDKVSAGHPLYCVRFREPRMPENKQALQDWLAMMQKDYVLLSQERFPFPRYDKQEKDLINISYIEMFKFIPTATSRASLRTKP